MPAVGPRSRMTTLSLVLFVLSGCAGLIYQAIWSHYLGLYLGHAAYAQSLVLAIFMGGMALGAWGMSRIGANWRNLLRAYAFIELAIGLAAAVFHPVFNGVVGFALDTALPAMPPGWGVGAFKWITGTALILPQAILLGMTFPLMSTAVIRRSPGADGAVLSGLYFANSIGAAAGALFATFVLLPAVGLPGAMRVGAIINILVALIAYVASRENEHAEPAPGAAAQDAPARVPLQGLLCWAAAITGATSFIYEIGWVRMLAMVLGSTVHAFELMLAAFIGGLAFGGLWVRSRIDGYRSLLRTGGVVQILMGLAALASLVIYDHSFNWVEWLLQALDRSDQGYTLYNAASATVAILVMAPAAFFAGMTLPIFTLALLRGGGGEPAVGRIYAANTIGAIVGVFLAIHLLIPVLGLKLAMIGAAAGDLVLGIVLLRRDRSEREGGALYLGSVAVCGLAIAATLVFARFDPVVMTSGVYRTGSAHRDPNEWNVVYYRDGKTASVGVVQTTSTGTRSIVTNGKPDAGLNMQGAPSPDESTMLLLGVLPLVLHPGAADVAAIGFGSGMSTHAALGDERVRRVDTIEIEPAMVEGARAFLPLNRRAYEDPRSFVHYEDAKSYFASHRSSYDVIISEPSNPWVAGVATLFSREFYELVPRYLKPHGLLVQWIQLYEIDEALLATIMNALGDAFVAYEVYQTGTGDMIVVASHDGAVGAMGALPAADSVLGGELARLDLRTSADFTLRKLGDKTTLAPYYAALTKRRNSDFYPVVSLEAPRTRFRSVSATYTDSLPIQDIALLEVLSGAQRPYGELTRSRGLPLSLIVRNAEGLVQLAQNGKYDASIADSTDASAAMTLRQVFGDCSAALPPSLVIASLSRVAGRTTPFLPREQAERLWRGEGWIRCNAEQTSVANMLELLRAEARRDWVQAGKRALDFLEHDRESLQPFVADRLVRLASLAAIAQGDFAAVGPILDRYAESVPPFGADGEHRRTHLRAYAASRLEAAPRPAQ